MPRWRPRTLVANGSTSRPSTRLPPVEPRNLLGGKDAGAKVESVNIGTLPLNFHRSHLDVDDGF